MGAHELTVKEMLVEFLKSQGSEKEPATDSETGVTSVILGVEFADQKGRLIVEGNESESGPILSVYIYYDIKCKAKKLSEAAQFLNEANIRIRFGCFEVLPNGQIRWRQSVQLKGCCPSDEIITQIVDAGLSVARAFEQSIVAVSITNTTSTEAISEFESARDSQSGGGGDDDAPDEL